MAPPNSLHEAIDVQATTTPDFPAVAVAESGDSSKTPSPSWCTWQLTYAEVAKRSRELARGLAVVAAAGVVAAEGPLLAVCLPRTHADFLPLLVAASRRMLPFVLMSTDLPDKPRQLQRNTWIMERLRPSILIVDELCEEICPGPGKSAICHRVAAVASLAEGVPETELPACSPHATMALLFTGGTQRMKVARCTHEMLLSEREGYPAMVPLGPAAGAPAPRMLGNASSFWPAAMLGQLSVAIAYGGCYVATESVDPTELRRVVERARIDVLGLVPDQLGLLSQEPARELPGIRLVLSWAEKLPPHIARRWQGHPRAVLKELLIATEYWLCLSADPLGPEPGTVKPLRCADVVALRLPEGDAAEEAPVSAVVRGFGEVGELCIAGPMVTPGYIDLDTWGSASKASSAAGGGPKTLQSSFIVVGGTRYFRTSDLVRVVPGGFAFVGRSDMFTKEKGQWVDMAEVESKLQALEGVADAKIAPDPERPSSFHAFVVLSVGVPPTNGGHPPAAAAAATPDVSAVPGALRRVRAALPQRVALHLISELPRNVATGKVDVAELRRAIQLCRHESWPLSGRLGPQPPQLLVDRLRAKITRQMRWSAFFLTVALASFVGPATLPVSLLGLDRRRDGPGRRLAVALQCFVVVANAGLGLLTMPYMHLAVLHGEDAGLRLANLVHEVPMGRFGSILMLHVLRRVWWAAHIVMLAWSGAGWGIAARRGRSLSWPVAFWAAIGHQADIECHRWLQPRYWRGYFEWQFGRLRDLMPWSATDASADAGAAPADASPKPSASPGVPGAAMGAGAAPGGGPGAESSKGHPSTIDTAAGDVAAVGAAAAEETSATAAVAAVQSVTKAHPAMVPDGGQGEQSSDGVGGEPEVGWPDGKDYSKDEVAQWKRDLWWWYNCTQTVVDFRDHPLREKLLAALRPASLADVEALAGGACCAGGVGCGAIASTIPAKGAAAAASLSPDPAVDSDAQALLALIEQADPTLRPATLDTCLLGLDSLRTLVLASLIQVRFGASMTGRQLQEAATPRQLLDVVRTEVAAAEAAGASGAAVQELNQGAGQDAEFVVWWSPGQYTPMGAWVLRSDLAIDEQAMLAATQWLIDRHSALRATKAEPLRLTSFMYDASILWSLYLPLAPTFLQRIVGWALAANWPRTSVRSRRKMYPKGWGNTPLEIVDVRGGQDEFERLVLGRQRGFVRRPPFDIALFRLRVTLLGKWTEYTGGEAEVFVADPVQPAGSQPGLPRFIYRDSQGGEGVLFRPHDAGWVPAPWGFPALFSARLRGGAGGIVWLRFEGRDQMKVVWKPDERHDSPKQYWWNSRKPSENAAPKEPAEGDDGVVVITFLFLQVFHSYADGACYNPLVSDLIEAYEHAIAAKASQGAYAVPTRPRPPEAFRILEGRLLDTLRSRFFSSDRHSMRGSVWKYSGQGYSHNVCFEGEVHDILSAISARYAIPLDYILLMLAVLGQARAGRLEQVELTLYVPMRDGHEVSMVGLFADWRDIAIAVPLKFTTVLGLAVQIADVLRQRRWSVFNALRKPEVTVCNFMHLDPQAQRGPFTQLMDGQWSGGDQLTSSGANAQKRSKELSWSNQALRFDFIQEHAMSWWISCKPEYASYPPSWMRRWIRGVEDGILDLVLQPNALVHRPFPEDL